MVKPEGADVQCLNAIKNTIILSLCHNQLFFYFCVFKSEFQAQFAIQWISIIQTSMYLNCSPSDISTQKSVWQDKRNVFDFLWQNVSEYHSLPCITCAGYTKPLGTKPSCPSLRTIQYQSGSSLLRTVTNSPLSTLTSFSSRAMNVYRTM